MTNIADLQQTLGAAFYPWSDDEAKNLIDINELDEFKAQRP